MSLVARSAITVVTSLYSYVEANVYLCTWWLEMA